MNNFDWNDHTVDFFLSLLLSACSKKEIRIKKRKFSFFLPLSAWSKREREGNEEKIRCEAKSFLQLLYLRLSSVVCVRPVTQLATYKRFLTFLHCEFSTGFSNCLPLYFSRNIVCNFSSVVCVRPVTQLLHKTLLDRFHIFVILYICICVILYFCIFSTVLCIPPVTQLLHTNTS